MGKDFMTEPYLKIYVYAMSAVNLAFGLLFVLLATLPKREGVLEDVLLKEGSASCVLLLVAGIFLVTTGLLGAIATFFAKPPLLISTYIFLSLVILIEIALAITFSVALINYKAEKNTEFYKVFRNYHKNETVRDYVDKIQREDKCCGVEGPEYWNGNLSKSCCRNPSAEKCKPWYKGCNKKYVGSVNDYVKRIVLVTLSVICFEAFVAVCASKLKDFVQKGPDVNAQEGEEQTEMPLTSPEPNKEMIPAE